MNEHITRLREEMQKAGIPALLLTDELNCRYLSGFSFSDGAILLLPDVAYLITDFRYREAAEKNADSGFTVVTPDGMLQFIYSILQENKITTLGFEDATASYRQSKRYEEYLKVALMPASDLLSTLRCRKTPDEIRKIAAAQALTDAAFTHILDYLRPGLTEKEVALELEFCMRKNGAEKVSFDTIAVSGTQSALPHGVPRDLPLEPGFLTMDFGCILDGYCSDMTRTVVIGRATPEMRLLYETVLEAQSAAFRALAPDTPGCFVDKAARDVIESAGYHNAFGHGLGHGVGLYIHENPRLSPKSQTRLLPGHVVTVEPGIYLPGQYGCRIEDMAVITEDGYRNLTHSRKDLIEIC